MSSVAPTGTSSNPNQPQGGDNQAAKALDQQRLLQAFQAAMKRDAEAAARARARAEAQAQAQAQATKTVQTPVAPEALTALAWVPTSTAAANPDVVATSIKIPVPQNPGASITREEFGANLAALKPGGEFASADDIKGTLLSMGIEVDPALATAIFETTKLPVGSTKVVSVGSLESLIFDQGSASVPGQTTPGALRLVSNKNWVTGMRLALDDNASAFDKLRFGWTGGADADTLMQRLRDAGAGVDAPSDNSSAPTLSQSDQNAFEWLVNEYGSNAQEGKIFHWGQISALARSGALNVDAGASLIDVGVAIHEALSGNPPPWSDGTLPPYIPGSDHTPLGDIQSNPQEWVGEELSDAVFTDDNQFVQDLENRGLTFHPTQLGLYRSTNPSDAATGPGALSVPELDAAISAGTYLYSVTDDGRVLVSLADPNAVLKNAIAAAPQFANGQSVNAEQLVFLLNGLTGTQRGDFSALNAEVLVNQFGDATTGLVTAAQLQGAVDFGALKAAVDPADNSIEIAVSEVVEDPDTSLNPQANFTGSLVRTPTTSGWGLDKVWSKSLLPNGQTTISLSDFAQDFGANSVGLQCGAFKFRAKDSAIPGKIDLEMSPAGKDAFTTVFTGAGDSVINSKQSYEWDAGALNINSVNSNDGDKTIKGGAYTRIKLNRTFQIYETDAGINNNNKFNEAFRSRTYYPVPVGTAAWNHAEPDPWPDLNEELWVDLRWGKIGGVPSAADPQKLVEYGVRLNAGAMGADEMIKSAIAGDWSGVAAAGKASPAIGASLCGWAFGLFEVQAAAKFMANKILGTWEEPLVGDNLPPVEPDVPRFYRTVPANIVNYIGETFQHWQLSGALSVQGTGLYPAKPSADTTQESGSALATQDAAAPPEIFTQLLEGIETPSDLGPMQDVFDALGSFDTSQLETAAQAASTAIATFAAGKEFVQAFKSRGASLFNNLGEDGKTKLSDLVMEEATRLMLEQSGMGPPEVLSGSDAPTMLTTDQQQKSLLMLPGETAAQYAARLGENIAANIGEAVKNVMVNEQTWDDLDPRWRIGGPSTGTGVAGLLGGVAATVAGAIASTVALVASVNNDPASNNDALNAALTQAQDVLTDAQAQLQLIREGGSNAGVGSIPDLQQRCRDAVAALQSAIAASPTASDDIKNKITGEVIPALQGVDADLQALLDDSGELSDSALNNMLGWPDGAAQQLPDDVVNQLITLDPATVSGLWDGGVPAELIVRVSPKLMPGDLDIPEFVPTLVADLQNTMASVDAAAALTEQQIADAVVHARYQDLLTAEQYSDPVVRQLLGAAATRLSVPLVRDALGRGFSVSETLTADSIDDLQGVLNLLTNTNTAFESSEDLLAAMKGKLQVGWTLSDIAVLDPLWGRPLADAIDTLTLDEIRSAEFQYRFWEGTEYLQGISAGPDIPDQREMIMSAVMYGRYFSYAELSELQTPGFLRNLRFAEQSGEQSPEAVVDYARWLGESNNPEEPPVFLPGT